MWTHVTTGDFNMHQKCPKIYFNLKHLRHVVVEEIDVVSSILFR